MYQDDTGLAGGFRFPSLKQILKNPLAPLAPLLPPPVAQKLLAPPKAAPAPVKKTTAPVPVAAPIPVPTTPAPLPYAMPPSAYAPGSAYPPAGTRAAPGYEGWTSVPLQVQAAPSYAPPSSYAPPPPSYGAPMTMPTDYSVMPPSYGGEYYAAQPYGYAPEIYQPEQLYYAPAPASFAMEPPYGGIAPIMPTESYPSEFSPEFGMEAEPEFYEGGFGELEQAGQQIPSASQPVARAQMVKRPAAKPVARPKPAAMSPQTLMWVGLGLAALFVVPKMMHRRRA